MNLGWYFLWVVPQHGSFSSEVISQNLKYLPHISPFSYIWSLQNPMSYFDGSNMQLFSVYLEMGKLWCHHQPQGPQKSSPVAFPFLKQMPKSPCLVFEIHKLSLVFFFFNCSSHKPSPDVWISLHFLLLTINLLMANLLIFFKIQHSLVAMTKSSFSSF